MNYGFNKEWFTSVTLETVKETYKGAKGFHAKAAEDYWKKVNKSSKPEKVEKTEDNNTEK